MGNKNTSPHLTKTLSINGHENSRFTQQHNVTINDDTDNSYETSSCQSSNGKKYGPSPRFRRRRDTRQTHVDKKGKKPQVCRINCIFIIYKLMSIIYKLI